MADRPERFAPDDPRYRAVVDKRFNKRTVASPDYVQRVSSTDDVVAAVQDAVTSGRRVVATSGGHCLEGFVSDPDVRVVVDVSPMKRIHHDTERRAVCIEAGATVGESFKALHDNWGVVVPLGEYPPIGMGGHVAGGAFGFLCRQLGLAADYLYGVELVTVDRSGRASAVVATREPGDPNRELWWGLTGAGGGNFGIVTRYWFRARDAEGNDPGTFLPRAPESMTTFRLEVPWAALDRSSFRRLLQNHGQWCESNAEAGTPNATLWALLALHRQQMGKVIVRGVSSAGPAALAQIAAHVAALSEGAVPLPEAAITSMSWLDFALMPFPDMFTEPPGGVRVKVKDALLRRRLTDRQISVAYDYLTHDDYDVMGGMLGMATYGGAINTVDPGATASAQRGAILDLACNTGWLDPADDQKNLSWVRAFYRDLFAATGGVPVPGDAYDGAFINHPDVDLADTALNTSGVPWHALYFRDNYARLQELKSRWDPRDVFRHALSIRLA